MSSTSQIHYCCYATGNPFTIIQQCPKKAPIPHDSIQSILAKLNRDDNQLRTLKHNATQTQVHFKISKGVLYLCVADMYMKVRVCYAFLDGLEEEYQRGALSEKSVMKNKLKYFNDPNNDKITKVQTEIDKTTEVIIEDIEKILPNLEGLEGNSSNTEDLKNTAEQFKKGSNNVKNRGCIIS